MNTLLARVMAGAISFSARVWSVDAQCQRRAASIDVDASFPSRAPRARDSRIFTVGGSCRCGSTGIASISEQVCRGQNQLRGRGCIEYGQFLVMRSEDAPMLLRA